MFVEPLGDPAMTSLAPVPSENLSCPNCSVALLADQRYCLSCGQPASPARLMFLDVLQSERAQPQAPPPGVPYGAVPVAYASYVEPPTGSGWLRRSAPLLSVLSVLLLALIAGLLVGHWVSQSKGSNGPEVFKIEGLASAPVAASPTATTPASPTPAVASKSKSSAKSEEEKEKAEAEAEEKAEEKAPAKAPAPAKDSAEKVSKLEKTTGKAKEKEVNEITTAPIEVK
jgi:hypothetical protein